MTDPLELDVAHLLAEAVGEEQGATPDDLAYLASEGERVHGDLVAARQRGELAFLELPRRDDLLEAVESAASAARGRFRDVLVLGIGGSALGTIAVDAALAPATRSDPDGAEVPRLHVLDNVDPEWMAGTLDALDPSRTLVNVISKSGGTAETAAQFLVARAWLRDRLGDRFRDHLVLTTDPASGSLRRVADREGIASLPVPPGVGGRYSVLSPVGLFPLALAGVEIRELLAGAQAMVEPCTRADLRENPAYLHGGLLHVLDARKGKRIHVFMPYAQSLRDVADWFRQLWAESLGKRLDVSGNPVHVGPTPVRALGTTDQHSQLQLYAEGPFDKVITFLHLREFRRDLLIPDELPEEEAFHYLGGRSFAELLEAEWKGTMIALTEASRPNSTVHFPRVDAHTVGQFLMLMQVQTAFAGGLYRVNPFDQPGVEASKEAAYALLGRAGYEERRRALSRFLGD